MSSRISNYYVDVTKLRIGMPFTYYILRISSPLFVKMYLSRFRVMCFKIYIPSKQILNIFEIKQNMYKKK